MKNRLTAFLTTGMMLASALTLLPVQAADDAADTATLPEWIPTSFEETLEFRNTYGATHIGNNSTLNDTVCVVFSGYAEKEYTVDNGNSELTEIFHKSFTDEASYTQYIVVAYTNYQQNAGQCSFGIELLDDEEECIDGYYFDSYGVHDIVEHDIYSWLPDCKTEYDDYIKNNGEVSVNNEYVVFCLEKNAGGDPYEWQMDRDSYNSAINEFYIGDCTEESIDPPDGGKEYTVNAISFKEDGRAYIKFNLVPMINSLIKPEDIVKSLYADCMVLDDCKTILLRGNVRYTFKDSDTGKNLDLPNSYVKMDVSPTIGYKTYTENVYSYEDTQVTADSNPYIWKHFSDRIPYVFDVELNENAVPSGYKLPEDYKTITKYENGAVDVEFRLKQDENALAPKTIRITLYDKDTGELIPDEILQLHPFTFGTDIRFKDPRDPERWMMTGPIFIARNNPYVCQDNLANLYRTADYFSFSGKYQPEVKVYDNNSMDLIFRIKIEAHGDVNGDGGFSIADLVMFEKWLLTGEGNEYKYWEAADFCTDGKLDVFDLCIMRKKLIERMNNIYTDFNAKYIQTKELNGHAGYPQRNLITSTDELEEYIDSKKDSLDLSEFKEASKDYNEEWFNNHKLLVVAFESTVNVTHEATGIIKGKTTQYSDVPNDFVQIESFIPEEGCYGQLINHPQILIELDNSFNINENFDLEFITRES